MIKIRKFSFFHKIRNFKENRHLSIAFKIINENDLYFDKMNKIFTYTKNKKIYNNLEIKKYHNYYQLIFYDLYYDLEPIFKQYNSYFNIPDNIFVELYPKTYRNDTFSFFINKDNYLYKTIDSDFKNHKQF